MVEAVEELRAPARSFATEEQVAFGVIQVRIGEEDRLLRTRKIAAGREWKAKLARQLGVTLAEFNVPGKGGPDTVSSLLALSQQSSEVVLDLVLDYDLNDNLGGREYVEANADESQVYAIFRAILERHFPFVRDVMGMLRELARLMADNEVTADDLPIRKPAPAPSVPRNSRNGRSRTGTSPRTTSRRG